MKAKKKRLNYLHSSADSVSKWIKKNLKPGDPVVVTWEDAVSYAGWMNHGVSLENIEGFSKHYHPSLCYNIGFFVGAEKDALLLAAARSKEGDNDPDTGLGGGWVVPLSWVLGINKVTIEK